MRIRQHKESGLWCREDGAVLMPPGGHFCKFRWTYGYKRKDGYLRVKYRGKAYLIHRLIAETFLDNPNGYPTVDHINRDKTDNRAFENLQWASRKMQQDNKQCVDEALAKYGVRQCEDKNAYFRAYQREYYAKQKALGKRKRTCPDGSCRFLTDEEFNKLYNKESV